MITVSGNYPAGNTGARNHPCTDNRKIENCSANIAFFLTNYGRCNCQVGVIIDDGAAGRGCRDGGTGGIRQGDCKSLVVFGDRVAIHLNSDCFNGFTCRKSNATCG